MAVTASPYSAAFAHWLSGSLAWTGGILMCALAGSEYSPDIDTHDFFNDVTGECIGQTGYTAGGASIANSSSSYTAATNTMVFDGDNVSWTNSTMQARYAILYWAKSTCPTSPLLGIVDFGSTATTNSGTLQITWSDSGILTMQGV